MSKKEVRQAAAELTERLCEKDFLDRSGLSRKNVMMLMNKDHWEEQFAHIFPIKKTDFLQGGLRNLRGTVKPFRA